MTQIFQAPYKAAVLYQYDNRWRTIWVDGRQFPEIIDGGVIAGGRSLDAAQDRTGATGNEYR